MEREILKLMDSVEDLVPVTVAKLDDDFLVCECFCVSVSDIKEADSLDLDLLQKELGLGNGCQGCIKRKEDWINKIF